MISLENARVVYHPKTRNGNPRCVLDVPQLSLEKGKRYALIGPNGAGKTTLIKVLAQLIPLTSGQVHIDATETSGIAYLPQNPFMFSGTVLHNVSLGLPRDEKRTDCALAALGKVGMTDFQKERASKLSGGEAQRVALARIIAQNQPIILLDEPTSATDIAGESKIEEALIAYWHESGCTLIFATHSPAQAGRLADEIIVLEQGRIIEKGAAKQVLGNPKNPHVQTFLNYWRLGERMA